MITPLIRKPIDFRASFAAALAVTLVALAVAVVPGPSAAAEPNAKNVLESQTRILVGGRVTNTDGVPLEGVSVTIISLDRGDRIEVTTDTDGDYVRMGLPITGPYLIRLAKDGYEPIEQQVRIRAGVNTVDIEMFSSAPFEAAREAQERALLINETYGVGRDAYGAGDFELAATSMREAIDGLAGFEGEGVAETSASAHSILGASLVELGEGDAAIEVLVVADELKPDDAVIKVTLGRAYAATGDYDNAQVLFERALELNPEDASTRYNVAIVLLRGGQVETAIRYFQEALELRPEFPLANKSLGYAFARTGEHASAVEHFRAYLEQAPEAPDRGEIESFITALESQ